VRGRPPNKGVIKMWNKIESIGAGVVLFSLIALIWLMIAFAIVNWNELPAMLIGGR